MTEHDRLRDLLEQAAPTDPDLTPTVRSTRVVRRARAARTRDRLLVGGAAVAVLAAAVAVPLSLRGGDEPEVATPAPTEPIACPAEPIDVSTPLEAAALGEVVSARACPAVENGPALPTTPLVDADAEAFAAVVLALPEYVFPDECAAMMVLPEPWAIVVGRADGDLVVIGSTVRLCGGVLVDGVERDPAAVIAAFEAAVS